MKAQPSSSLTNNRSSFLPKKRASPSSSDSGFSEGPECAAKQQQGTSLAGVTFPRRPPLRRTTPKHILSSDHVHRSSTEAIAFERELQNLLEVEYRDDVQEYMYEMEMRTAASVELIDLQPELQWYMRPYLVDFLIEIHQQHALRSETLYLAMNIVDRYVSKRIVFKKHYQLVGCAALWIAAKFEDAKDRVPTVQELAAACCQAYEESAFIQMEGHVLSTIGWVLGHPTAEAWLRLASIGYGLEEQRVQHTSRFLMEITLFHRAFVAYKASDAAVACLLLARFMLGKPRRPEYETEHVMQIVQMLDGHLAEHLDQVSAIVIRKYSYAFYSRSSTFAREWFLSGKRFCLMPLPDAPSSDPFSAHSTPSSSRDRSSYNGSSPLTSPTSECNFDSSDSCSDFDDDDEPEPLTPITPLSACSLVDPMDCHQVSPTAGKAKMVVPVIKESLWDTSDDTAMALC